MHHQEDYFGLKLAIECGYTRDQTDWIGRIPNINSSVLNIPMN